MGEISYSPDRWLPDLCSFFSQPSRLEEVAFPQPPFHVGRTFLMILPVFCLPSIESEELPFTLTVGKQKFRNLFWLKTDFPYLLPLKNPILGEQSLPSLGILMQIATELTFLSCSTGDRGH